MNKILEISKEKRVEFYQEVGRKSVVELDCHYDEIRRQVPVWGGLVALKKFLFFKKRGICKRTRIPA